MYRHRQIGSYYLWAVSVILSKDGSGGGSSLYDVTFCLTAWSHVPSQGSLSRGSLSRGVCVQGYVSVQRKGSLSIGVSVQGKGSLSSTVSVQGISVQRSQSKGLCPRICLCPGGEVIVQESLCPGESLPRRVSARGGVSVRDIHQNGVVGEVVVGSLVRSFSSMASK